MKYIRKIIIFVLTFAISAQSMPFAYIGVVSANMPSPQSNGFIADIDNAVPDNAIHISTAGELTAIVGGEGSAGKYYVLDNDIVLENEWNPINDFRGIFDGQGHTISNLYVCQESQKQYAGLFGIINTGNNVTIKNVGVNISENNIYSQTV